MLQDLELRTSSSRTSSEILFLSRLQKMKQNCFPNLETLESVSRARVSAKQQQQRERERGLSFLRKKPVFFLKFQKTFFFVCGQGSLLAPALFSFLSLSFPETLCLSTPLPFSLNTRSPSPRIQNSAAGRGALASPRREKRKRKKERKKERTKVQDIFFRCRFFRRS